MASSIHIQKASGGAVAHNSRESFSHSVVFPDEKNEILNNSKQAFALYRNELAIRSQAYSDRTGQTLQKKAITHLSSVVNLQQHHTLKDLQSIKDYIEKKFDTKVFQMAIHRDEGKLVSKADEKLVYTSGHDFFKCPKTNELFWDKKYTEKINLDEYNIVKNYHAHIEFMGLTSTGEAVKRNYMSKYNLSELQTFVAKALKMERGKNYYESKERAPRRLDVHEYKRVNAIQRSAIEGAVKELATVKDVANQYKLEREKLKQSGTAAQQDYSNLKKQYEELKAQAQAKDLTIQELTSTVRYYRESYRPAKEKELKIERERTNALQEQVSTLERENVSLRSFVSVLEQEKEELKEEVTKLQAIVDKVSSFFSATKDTLIDKVTSFFAKKSETSSFSSPPLERSDIERASGAPSASEASIEDLFHDPDVQAQEDTGQRIQDLMRDIDTPKRLKI